MGGLSLCCESLLMVQRHSSELHHRQHDTTLLLTSNATQIELYDFQGQVKSRWQDPTAVSQIQGSV